VLSSKLEQFVTNLSHFHYVTADHSKWESK